LKKYRDHIPEKEKHLLSFFSLSKNGSRPTITTMWYLCQC